MPMDIPSEGRPLKRVLITGAAGFTGRYMARELEAHGWEVWGTDALDKPQCLRYRRGDLTDRQSLRRVVDEIRPHAVVHLAGIAFVAHEDIDALYRINLLGTRNLLAALAESVARPRCVLVASSANVYGNRTEGILSEATPANPVNDYAVSKLAMEYMARLWLDRLPVVLARPFNYTGVGQSEAFLLPKIVAHFRRRAEVIELGNLDVWRDFSDVRAVVHAYRRLLETCPAGESVNVCSGRTHSLREVLAMAGALTGHRIRVVVHPALVRQNEVKTLCGDPFKLRSLIGDWETPPLEETLGWMLETD
jgi:GDP-6-deoxy-D-talose 4-dehydrogenase